METVFGSGRGRACGTALRCLRAAAVASLAAALAACGIAKDFTFKTPELEKIHEELVAVPLWYRQGQGESGDAGLQPFVGSGRLFVPELGDRMLALDAGTGRRLWEVRIKPAPQAPDKGMRISSGVGAGEGLLFAGTRDGELLALEPEDGKVRWRAQLSSEVLVPPIAQHGIVVVRTNDGRLYGLDVKDGHSLWVYTSNLPSLTLRANAQPAIADGHVYAGFANGNLVAAALDTGEVLWETTVAIPEGRTELDRMVDVDTTPVVAGDTVYAAAYQGRVVAVAADTGRVQWSRDLSSYRDLLLEGDKLFVTAADGRVLALDSRNGAILWNQDKLVDRGVTGPVIQAGTLAVADAYGYLHWLSPEDGHFLGRYRMSAGAITVTPVVADDVLYVSSSDGALQALKVRAKTASGL